MVGGLVLAAGGSSRFGGRPKQLAMLDGKPLLEHVLLVLSEVPLERVTVVLGAHADEVRKRVPLHGAEAVVCTKWESGMGESLRTGIDAMKDCEAVVVALGDQPRLSPEAVRRVIGQRGKDELAVRATYGGVPGHPVLLERSLMTIVRETARGDSGARNFLHGVPLREVACDGLGSPDDIDTPEALAALNG